VKTDRQLVDRLRKIPLFAACTKDELQQIATAASTLTFPAGTVLAREGDVGREFMVIVDGTADVVIGGVIVNHLGPDDSFGEVALLDGGLRTATVTASTDVVAHVIEQREFAVLVFDSHSLARKLLIGVAKLLRSAELRLHEADRSTR
jgi:CRP/FNR family transcriptional regulator, cyclic AMP receptor protein